MARTHGTISCYVHGFCRCDECRLASRDKRRRLRQAQRGEFECAYCPQQFETVKGRSKHQTVVHPDVL